MGLTLAALLSACYFYGVGFNLIFLLPALLAPLLLIATCSVRRMLAVLQANRLLMGLSGLTLLLLVGHQLFFSISPDTSYAASLIAAALPLWALVAVLYARRALLVRVVFAVVLMFACISTVDYLVSGQRAHAPLWDPNNFVSLLYLAWMPWAFARLADAPDTRSGLGWTFLISMIFALALLAAHSRVAMMVVASVAVGGLLCCWWFRLQWRHSIAVAMACLLAAGLYLGIDPSGASSAMTPQTVSDSGDHRLLMLEAALAAVRDFGGVHGTGLYTFAQLYPLYRSPLEQNTVGVFVHNDYVQILLEGGVWLALPLLVLCACVVVTGLRLAAARIWHPRIGLLLAVGFVMVHAAVNYVFYVLPLTLVLGLYIGVLFAREPVQAGNPRGGAVPTASAAKWIGVVLLALNCFYLCIDALTLGVFANQLHVPASAHIKSDPARMLAYARFAQTVNSSRGVPVLGEAMLLDNQLSPDSPRAQVVRTELVYRHAIKTDPWNSLGHVSYARFLLRHAAALGTGAQDRAIEQLRRALQLAPGDVDASAELFALYRRRGEIDQARELAMAVLNWCERIRRRGVPAEHRVFKEIAAVAVATQSEDLAASLQACRNRSFPASSSGREPTWMMRWLRSFSHPDS